VKAIARTAVVFVLVQWAFAVDGLSLTASREKRSFSLVSVVEGGRHLSLLLTELIDQMSFAMDGSTGNVCGSLSAFEWATSRLD
jgi:hypothetical protein